MGDQTKLTEHMLTCIEQKVCNISCNHPCQKMNFKEYYVKIDPPVWITADFECMHIPVDDYQFG